MRENVNRGEMKYERIQERKWRDILCTSLVIQLNLLCGRIIFTQVLCLNLYEDVSVINDMFTRYITYLDDDARIFIKNPRVLHGNSLLTQNF